MGYDRPTLDELTSKVSRDLRDEDLDTFSAEQVQDFINEAISELNIVRPIEMVWQYSDFDSLSNPMEVDDEDEVPDIVKDIWAVEMLTEGGYRQYIPPNNTETTERNGWEYYQGTILFGTVWATRLVHNFDLDNGFEVHVFGYTDRDLLEDGDEHADFQDSQDEFAVRRYARLAGLRALDEDRALFQQWQAATQNTDISPTQLTNMLQTAESNWMRHVKRIMRIRRAPVGNG